MRGYSIIEQGVITAFKTYFAGIIDPNCISDDEDVMFDNIFTLGETYGILFKFGGGDERPRSTFKNDDWVWNIVGALWIRYTADHDEKAEMEVRLKTMIDMVAQALRNNTSVGGVSPLAKVQAIDIPEIIEVNDTPFYMLSFLIHALDKS